MKNMEIEDRRDAAGVIYQYVCECWYRMCVGYGGRGESLKGQFTQKLDTYSRSRFQRFGHKMQIICMNNMTVVWKNCLLIFSV